MVDGNGASAYELTDVLVRVWIVLYGGVDKLLAEHVTEWRARGNPPAKSRRRDTNLHITRVCEVLGVNDRPLAGIRRGKPHGADALRQHERRQECNAVGWQLVRVAEGAVLTRFNAEVLLARLWVGAKKTQPVDLHVVAFGLVTAWQTSVIESHGLDPGVAEDALAEEHVLGKAAQEATGERPARHEARAFAGLHGVGHGPHEVVLKVLAHGQVLHAIDAVLLQVGLGAQTREHQQVRSADGTATHHHLLGRAHVQSGPCIAFLLNAHANRLLPAQGDACRVCIAEDREVRACQRSGPEEEGRCRVATHAVLGRDLRQGDAPLGRPVVILGSRQASGLTGLDHPLAYVLVRKVSLSHLADLEGPSAAVRLAAAAVHAQEVLAPLEEGQNVVVAPALAAQTLRPMIIIPGVAPDVEHVVDGAAAPEALAARPIGHAAVGGLLRGGAVGPIQAAVLQEGARKERPTHPPVLVAAARLDEKH
mmetsp:Transcript_96969/g.313097  ORF Transcript_96969/g.313097 Transcript_96969/m.313097 type:complete len:479 (-) Transcript_96969:289-1725(-)